MATDPRPSRRSRRRARRLRRGSALHGTWWQQARRPLLHLVVTVSCLSIVLLLAAGHPGLALLVLAGAVAAAAVEVRTQRRQQQQCQATREHAERVVELVYEDWLRDQAQRGHLELERWRRTHRP